MALAAALVLLAFISRRPDAVTHAQFWAEDGTIWYADAYNHGLAALLWPYNGYLQELSRLVADLAQPLPLLAVPLVFNVVALAVQVLPAAMLLSPRFDAALPSLSFRLLAVALYTGLPNSHEIDANLTNAQWHLALIVALVVLSSAPRTLWSWAFDAGALAVAGLTGPFAVLLAPLALAASLRNRRRLLLAFLLSATALVQAAVLFSSRTGRRHFPGVGLQLDDSRILAGQVLVSSLVGNRGYRIVHATAAWQQLGFPLLLALLAALPVAYALWRGTRELRVLVAFAGLVLLALFFGPQDSPAPPEVFASPESGNRYYFLPILAWYAVLLWLLLRAQVRALRITAAACLAVACFIAIPADWRYPPYPESGFAQQVAAFDQAPSKQAFTFVIDPPGWTMQLRKR